MSGHAGVHRADKPMAHVQLVKPVTRLWSCMTVCGASCMYKEHDLGSIIPLHSFQNILYIAIKQMFQNLGRLSIHI